MKIYIASRTSDRNKVIGLNKKFKKIGYSVLDWTWHKNTKPYEKHKKIAKDYSIEDINFVKKCDVFILLTSEVPGSGSTSEFGMALFSYASFKKPKIYVVGPHMNNMFFYHPAVEIRRNMEEVIKELVT